MENQPTKLDKAVKISIIAGALLVVLSVLAVLIFYTIIKPRIEDRIYNECLGALRDSGKLNNRSYAV